MQRKTVQALVGVVMGMALMAAPVMAEEAVTEAAIETEISTEATEAVEETEIETESTTEALEEGTAVLADYGYELGEIDENGWKNEGLNLKYEPGKGIAMGVEENEKLEEYHGRFGKDKHVAFNEMVALDKNEGYVQLMVEVNPNNEGAEDVLDRFAENEALELVGKTKETEIGGKTFSTRTGVKDKKKYLIGVCVDEDNLVLALKIRYADSDARKALLKGFSAIEEEETEIATEAATEAVTEAAEDGISMPEEFEAAEEITEAETDGISVSF